jgi:hypothetical protein
MNASTVDYFVGMATGLDSKKELDAGHMLGYYGVGWELNNIPTNYTHLEAAELATAKSLKALRPGIKIGVTRNTVVAASFWESAQAVMTNPATKDYWLLCGDGKPCTAKWGLDEPCSRSGGRGACDPTSYLFNWSNPGLQDWFVYDYIGQAANETLVDAVFFDAGVNASAPSLDGTLPVGFDPAAYLRDGQVTFDRATALLAEKGKWASSWVGWGTKGTITRQICVATMGDWLHSTRNGTSTDHTFVPTTMAFSKCFRHPCHHQADFAWHPQARARAHAAHGQRDPPYPHSSADQNATVAAFMIARPASALLQLHVVRAPPHFAAASRPHLRACAADVLLLPYARAAWCVRMGGGPRLSRYPPDRLRPGGGARCGSWCERSAGH